MRDRLLMCAPTYFGVEYVINPWMEGHIGRASRATAEEQWARLRDAFAAVADVELVPPAEGLPDMPFVANAGLVGGPVAVPSNFRHPERKGEEEHFIRWFSEHGLRVVRIDPALSFEGEGDALFQPGEPLLWVGYGFRTMLESHRALPELFGAEVVSLRLVDDRFYHLDTCFAALPGGRVMYYPPAFDEPSRDAIERRVPAEKRLAVGESDALGFACNAVEVGGAVFLNAASDALRARLAEWGLRAVPVPLGEFMLAGGAAKCLVLRLSNPGPAAAGERRFASPIRDRRVELQGHLLDTGLLSRAFDLVTEHGGAFEVESFRAGAKHRDPSEAVVRIAAPSGERLDRMVAELLELGASPITGPADARLEPAPGPGVAPADFYSTTIHPTEVRVGGQWIAVGGQRMDAVVVAGSGKARCTLIRNLRAGDRVVCGVDGIRVHPILAVARAGDEAAAPAPVEPAVEQLSWEMRRIRERRGRIVVAAGPAAIHTGGGPHLARLIRAGYVQALLGGNALAAHDLELQIFGTSAGIHAAGGHAVLGGRQHAIRAINLVRGHGGIREAVAAGLIRDGVMHACIASGVPFVLAGSIRDEGPLPETVSDVLEAQAAYAAALDGADLILLLSAEAAGRAAVDMTRAGVKLVAIDPGRETVLAAHERGPREVLSVVTDVGLFLSLLAQRLCA